MILLLYNDNVAFEGRQQMKSSFRLIDVVCL